jgi:hypothetical protein
MIEWLLIAVGAVLAGAATASLSSDVRQSVAAWLRTRGLARTALMDAWLVLDRSAGAIRAALRLTTTYGTQELVLDRRYQWDQIDDPEVRTLLRRRRHVELHVLDQI